MGDHNHQSQWMSSSNLELPPGFCFYPSDEEIITSYLTPKVHQRSFTCIPIKEVDLNRTEPWELPDKAKAGDSDWYFFYQKDRKYPTGTRMNQATKDGHWKATGRDKEIYSATKDNVPPVLIGMKKTLVFYMGRAPTGKKTSWIMHEYRLVGNDKPPYPKSSSSSTTTKKSSFASEGEWVVCHVSHKTTGIMKAPFLTPFNMAMASGGIDQSSMSMPVPLQFPMPNITMNSSESYYSNTGMSSLPVPAMLLPMECMDNAALQLNKALFGNPMVMTPPMSFYDQMGMGTSGTNSFMASLESGPLSEQTINATNILPVGSTTPESGPTMDMNGFLRY
ncbi:unnamed protein product [Urochloa decumbens]|uniref:NAC domain-containing protein n=1 Tax=Urochloa decumbens TaxID=240449 RepID=A0ABC9FRS6_9POAL